MSNSHSLQFDPVSDSDPEHHAWSARALSKRHVFYAVRDVLLQSPQLQESELYDRVRYELADRSFALQSYDTFFALVLSDPRFTRSKDECVHMLPY